MTVTISAQMATVASRSADDGKAIFSHVESVYPCARLSRGNVPGRPSGSIVREFLLTMSGGLSMIFAPLILFHLGRSRLGPFAGME